MTKFYQACFSRLGGNDLSAGWQALNVSEGMPRQLKELFERNARADQPSDFGTPRDQHGNPLCMLEVYSNGEAVGITRVQYGLADSFGRENMFCHGYLFADAYELLKDPNNILCVADGNFRFTPEETAQIPEQLQLTEPFTQESALELCRIDREAYVRLVSCVYYALATNAKTTIHVRTDGSDDMARALLYLVYTAIPYSLRPKVTASTYATQNSMLVFSGKLPENGLYVDLLEGEDNILTNNLKNRWKRYPFVSYFASTYERDETADFDAMESWLIKMGDRDLKDMDALRLAYVMMGQSDTADVTGLLYDWLALPVPSNETLEQSVLELLQQVVDQDISLGKETEALLAERLETATSKELIALAHRYHADQLIKMSQEEANEFLAGLGSESPLFAALREKLAANEAGLRVLCGFYTSCFAPIDENPDLSYEELGQFVLTFSDLEGMQSLWDAVSARAIAIVNVQVLTGKEFKALTNELVTFISQYVNVPAVADTLRKSAASKLTSTFDNKFRTHYDPRFMAEYDVFYKHLYPNVAKFDHSRDLLDKFHCLEEGRFAVVAEYVARGCKCQNQGPRSPQEAGCIAVHLLAYALECGAAESCGEITFWIRMAAALNRTATEVMLESKVKLLCDPESLTASLSNDPYWDEEKIKALQEEYKAYTDEHPEFANKRVADAFVKNLKFRAEEERRLERERKRNEKKEKDKEREREREREREERRRGKKPEEPAEENPWDDLVNSEVPTWDPTTGDYEDQPPAEEEKPKKKGFFASLFGGGNRSKK